MLEVLVCRGCWFVEGCIRSVSRRSQGSVRGR